MAAAVIRKGARWRVRLCAGGAFPIQQRRFRLVLNGWLIDEQDGLLRGAASLGQPRRFGLPATLILAGDESNRCPSQHQGQQRISHTPHVEPLALSVPDRVRGRQPLRIAGSLLRVNAAQADFSLAIRMRCTRTGRWRVDFRGDKKNMK
jgi:hypothetical protein